MNEKSNRSSGNSIALKKNLASERGEEDVNEEIGEKEVEKCDGDPMEVEECDGDMLCKSKNSTGMLWMSKNAKAMLMFVEGWYRLR